MGWGRQSGGVALLNHRLQAGTPGGVRFHLVWFPVVSLVPSSTTGYEPSSLRDEETSMAGPSGCRALGAKARAAVEGMGVRDERGRIGRSWAG